MLNRKSTAGTSLQALPDGTDGINPRHVLIMLVQRLRLTSFYDDSTCMSNFQYESAFSEANTNALDDRRREIRFNDGERAVIVWSHNAEARSPMELINRSQQGLCVRSEEAVPPGALGTILRILPWSEAENRRAVVTWCHADESDGWQLGLRFVDSRPNAA